MRNTMSVFLPFFQNSNPNPNQTWFLQVKPGTGSVGFQLAICVTLDDILSLLSLLLIPWPSTQLPPSPYILGFQVLVLHSFCGP